MLQANEKITTAEQLFAAGDRGRCELVNGELIEMTPAGYEHGQLVLRIGRMLEVFISERDLGQVSAAVTGF